MKPRQPAKAHGWSTQGATAGVMSSEEDRVSTTERASFTDLLAERGVLIADGATGTNYQSMGMEPGLAPEEWLFQAPERVVELHRAFVDAGADIVLTCTFGATPLRLNEGPLVGQDPRGESPRGRARARGRRRRAPRRGLARPDRAADRALRAAEPRGRDRRVRASRRARWQRAASTCSCWRRSSPSRRPCGRSRGSRARPTFRSSCRSRSTWGRGR